MEHLLGICCALKLGIMRNEDGNNNKRRACNRKPYGTWWLIAHYSDAFVTINASRCRRQVRCRKGKEKIHDDDFCICFVSSFILLCLMMSSLDACCCRVAFSSSCCVDGNT